MLHLVANSLSAIFHLRALKLERVRTIFYPCMHSGERLKHYVDAIGSGILQVWFAIEHLFGGSLLLYRSNDWAMVGDTRMLKHFVSPQYDGRASRLVAGNVVNTFLGRSGRVGALVGG